MTRCNSNTGCLVTVTSNCAIYNGPYLPNYGILSNTNFTDILKILDNSKTNSTVSIVANNTPSLTLTGGGTISSPLLGNVVISPSPANLTSVVAGQGVFTRVPTLQEVTSAGNTTDNSIIGVTEAINDNSSKLASTAWVRLQNYIVSETDPVAQAKTISLTEGTGISIFGTTQTIGSNPQFTISANNDFAIWNADSIQNVPISTNTPLSGQVLVYNGSQWIPGSGTGGVSSVAVTSSDITVSGSPITSSGTINLTLPNIVTSGTYNLLTVNAKGQVTAGSNQPYITTESDPTVPNYVKSITQGDIDNWNNAFDKYTTGVSVSGTTTKTITITLNDTSTVQGAFTDNNNFTSNLAFNNLTGDLTLSRSGLTDIITNLDGRYLTFATESDPTVPAHVKAITTGDISNWNTAYNDKINTAVFSTGTLTLTQQDGGTIIATGLTTSIVTEGSNLYYTDTRVQTFADTRYALKVTTILPSGNGLLGGGDLSTNRTFSLDFSYLDDRYLSGYKQREAVRVATTGNITLSGSQTIDGITLTNGDRVLVKNQTAAENNGIYIYNSSGAWTRATDFDQATPEEISQGSQIFVQEGTVNGKTGWSLASPEPYTIGTTALNFIQYSGANTYTAGTGLTLVGNQFSAQTTTALWNANQLRGVGISTTAPTSNQILRYDGTNWSPFTPNYLTSESDPVAIAKTVTLTQGAGITITGTATQTIGANPSYTISHSDTSSIVNIDTTGAQVIDTISFDTYGHATAFTLRSLTPSDIGAGTVISVGLAMPAIFSVSGSPVTTSGTLTASLATQSANLVFAGPTSGAAATPTFRSLVANDIPSLDASKITSGVFPVARGGTGLSALGTANQLIRVNSGATALEYFTPTYLTGNQTITLSGDVTGSGDTAIGTTISNNAVTYAKIQDVTSQKLLGRYAATNGDVQEITLGSGLSLDTSTGVLTATASGTGTVTSVGLSLPSIFSVTGSPITTAGTLTASLVTQGANLFFASPTGTTGTPSFRSIVNNDLPDSGVTAGSYNTLTVNSKGIVTSASNTSYVPTTRTLTITAGSGVSVTPNTAQSLSANISWTITNTGVRSVNGSTGDITIDVNGNLKTGSFTASGNGTSTFFDIPHTLIGTPSFVSADAASLDARGISYREALNNGTTNVIRVYYDIAPPAGSNNIIIKWSARL